MRILCLSISIVDDKVIEYLNHILTGIRGSCFLGFCKIFVLAFRGIILEITLSSR
jgi:hypothetical protein